MDRHATQYEILRDPTANFAVRYTRSLKIGALKKKDYFKV